MIRRLFVCMTVLGCLLLPGVGKVEAQCTPSNKPNLGISVQAVDPSQVPYAAVTLNMSYVNAQNAVVYAHSLAIGSGTQLQINFKSWNADSTKGLGLYYSTNHGNRVAWATESLNGSFPWTFTGNAGDTLQVYAVVYEKIGSGSPVQTTQDIVNLTFTNQPPGVYGSDGLPNNVYHLVTGTYGGTPNIDPNQCPQAYEGNDVTPQIQLNVSNITSGVNVGLVANGSTTLLTQDAPAISASTFAYLPGMPGDTITGNLQGVLNCTAIGSVFADVGLLRIEIVKTITKDLGHPPTPQPDGTEAYEVAPLCDHLSDPPDWAPNVVLSGIGQHTYWYGITECIRIPDVSGNPWRCMADFMDQIATWTGSPAAKLLAIGSARPYNTGKFPFFSEPIPGPCTNYDKGQNIIKSWSPTESPIPYPW